MPLTARNPRAPRKFRHPLFEALESRLLFTAVSPADGILSTATLITPTKATTFGQSATLQGQLVAFGASVAKTTISLMDLDTNTDLQDVTVPASGKFKFTFIPSSATMHLAASFPGTLAIAPCQSDPLTFTVAPAATKLSLKLDPTGNNLTAAIALPSHFPASFLSDLNGTLTLLDAGQAVATASIDATTSAIFNAQALSVGAHTLTVSFSGNGLFLTESLTAKMTIPLIRATTTTVTVSASPKVAANVQLTAMVRPTTTGGPAVSGTVAFYSASDLVGTAKVAGGRATLTTKFLYPGEQDITAVYTPGSPHMTSTSTVTAANVTEPNEIDILALYTPQTLQASGSVDAIQSQLQAEIDDTNQAFINSQIPAFVHLTSLVATNYTESGDLQTDLDRLFNPGDGYMDEVLKKRIILAADLVVLVDSQGTDDGEFITEGIGMENLHPTASNASIFSYIVIDQSAPEGDYVLAHEIGHTLGATHAVGDPTDQGATPYAHGYRFRGTDGVLYHDIMAYDPGTTIPYFSNPNLTFAGVPEGNPNSANAARVITQDAPLVSKYFTPGPYGELQNFSVSGVSGFVFDPAFSGPIAIRITIDNNIASTFTPSDVDSAETTDLGITVYHFAYTPPLLSPTTTHIVKFYAIDPISGKALLMDEELLTA